MKIAPILAGLSLAAISLTACGGGGEKNDTAAPSTIAAVVTASASATPASSSPTAPSTSASVNTSSAMPPSTSASTPQTATQAAAPTAPSGVGEIVPAPSEAEADATARGVSSTRACDSFGDIQANASASCPFAEAVVREWQAHRVAGGGVIYVKSPTTGATYGVRCSTGAHGSACVTSRGAYVWAPI